MQDRIKVVRKSLKLTQDEFSKRINIARTSLALMESGKLNMSNRTISDICKEFNVNEEWLRTGSGNMFKEITKKEAITDFFADILNDEPDTFRFRLINALAELPVEEWEMLADLCDRIANSKNDNSED